jgi:hypothetical protein
MYADSFFYRKEREVRKDKIFLAFSLAPPARAGVAAFAVRS